MISPNTNKSLTELLSLVSDSISDVMNCIKIGEIVSFNKNNQTVSVKILHKKVNEYYNSSKVLIEYPVLEQVPCVIMGGGNTYISHPISAGDQCVLLFNDYMLDDWKISGQERSPGIPRQHDISDAIAIVGLNALPKAIQNYSDFLDLHYSDNSSIIIGETIEVNNATINLNGDVNVSGNETVAGNMDVTGEATFASNVAIAGNTSVTGGISATTLTPANGASGSFVSKDDKTVTVENGIITSIGSS